MKKRNNLTKSPRNRIIKLAKRDTYAQIQLRIKETAILGLHQITTKLTYPTYTG